MITAKFYTSLPQEAKDIRTAVFVDEQHFTVEFDEIDNIATHVVLWQSTQSGENIPVACCRFYPDKTENTYIVGRLAVLKPYRGHKLGERLLTETEQYLQQRHVKRLSLSAQVRVQKFYEKQGYQASGEIYYDEYCEHIHMEKYLHTER